MGYIAASTANDTFYAIHPERPPVNRRKLFKVKDVIEDKGIPIFSVIRKESSALSSVTYKRLSELQISYTLPSSIYTNLL